MTNPPTVNNLCFTFPLYDCVWVPFNKNLTRGTVPHHKSHHPRPTLTSPHPRPLCPVARRLIKIDFVTIWAPGHNTHILTEVRLFFFLGECRKLHKQTYCAFLLCTSCAFRIVTLRHTKARVILGSCGCRNDAEVGQGEGNDTSQRGEHRTMLW